MEMTLEFGKFKNLGKLTTFLTTLAARVANVVDFATEILLQMPNIRMFFNCEATMHLFAKSEMHACKRGVCFG